MTGRGFYAHYFFATEPLFGLTTKTNGTMTKFFLETRADKSGEFPIRVSATAGGKRLLTSIGYSISSKFWDEQTGRAIEGTKKSPVVNAKGIAATAINARIAAIAAAFATIDAAPASASVEAYSIALKSITGKKERNTAGSASSKADKAHNNTTPSNGYDSPRGILNAFDLFVEEEGAREQWAEATYKSFRSFRRHLQCFDNRLTFESFDEDGITAFIKYLRTRATSAVKEQKLCEEIASIQIDESLEKSTREALISKCKEDLAAIAPEGLNEKSAQKRYKELRWFLTWAVRKGYTTEQTINTYKAKFKIIQKPVIFLTLEELNRLRDYVIPENGTVVELTDGYGRKYEKTVREAGALNKTRDLFCFCAYTSLRYSDMAQLKRRDVYKDAIHVVTEKTDKPLEIPLNNYSRAILKKYESEDFRSGLALPVIANQKMNFYLKDLCELCGFNELITISEYRNGDGKRSDETCEKWQLISTHAGRRTFICLALSKGMTPNMVMNFTGHSDYDAMKPYIAIAADDATKAMRLLND